MKAVALYANLPVTDPVCLVDVEVPNPVAAGSDLLVKVRAISVNPVDVKQRIAPNPNPTQPRILGWDATGIVVETGPDVSLFKKGDEVYYAGSIIRAGCNSEFHLVDERIVGRKPATLSFQEAAALPLTSITAWEALFDRCGIRPTLTDQGNTPDLLLIIGGAGGVGSIATQLAKKVAGVTVVATASRSESADWCRSMGADFVINHRRPLKQELAALGIDGVNYVLCCNSIELYAMQLAEIIKPQGKICSIIRAKDDQPLQINALMYKSVAFVWELMFTRSMFQTSDMIEQHHLLNRVSELVDLGEIRTTFREDFGALTAENLRKAHARIESGEMIGKLTLTVG